MYLKNDDLEEELFFNRKERKIELVSAYPCNHNKYFDCCGCGECILNENEQ